MRKPRDFDAELKALEDKARDLKSRKMQPCNRHRSAQARHDMRDWQMERRHCTRHLIELAGLIVKAGVVDLTGDDRAMI